MKILKLLVGLVLVLIFSLHSQAQQTNTTIKNKEKLIILSGVVYDPNGAVVTNTRITVRTTNNRTIQTVSNSEGIFELKLSPASYQIEFESSGFKRLRLSNFKVVNSTYGKMNQDVVLEISEAVTPLPIEGTKKPK